MPNSNGRSNKGKRKHQKSFASQPKNPHLRGRPGVLLTCETGREVECEREGMEIIQYYINRSKPTESNGKAEENGVQDESSKKDSKKSSLDEELENLRKQSKQRPTKQQHPDLAVHDTGCNGMVLVLCTLPDCHVVPPVFDPTAKPSNEDTPAVSSATTDSPDATDKANSEPQKKKAKKEHMDESKASNEKDDHDGEVVSKKFVANEKEWDPVQVVREILLEASKKTNLEAPSSRFVLRVIPLQATCFASMKEIVALTRLLLQRVLHQMEKEATDNSATDDGATSTTFSINAKRRYCDHLSTQTLIKTLGAEVANLAPTWKVDLTNPTVKIWVEVCRTTVGISVFRVGDLSKIQANFNMAELLLASSSST